MNAPCTCLEIDCPTCSLLPPPACLPEGTRVVPLDSEAPNYREWLVRVDGTQYCIVDEAGAWTLLVSTDTDGWHEVPLVVETFLAKNRLILAA